MVKFTCKVGPFGVLSDFCRSIMLEDRKWNSDGFILVNYKLISCQNYVSMREAFDLETVYVDFFYKGEDENEAAASMKSLVMNFQLVDIVLIQDISQYPE